MTGADATRDLQAFVDERWAVAQPRFYPEAADAPRVPADVTPREAADFLAAVTSHGDEALLLVVDDDRRERSDRYPPLSDGRPRCRGFESLRPLSEASLPPGQIVGGHFPSTYVASESPGQGGMETQMNVRSASPVFRY